MSTTSFLKNLGIALAKGLAIVAGIGPIIEPFLGSRAAPVADKAINDFTAIGQLILTIETAFQGNSRGAEKLAAVTPMITQIIRTSELVAGRQIDNEQLLIDGSQDIASGMVKVLNAVHPKVETSGDPLPTPAAPPPVTPAA